jgi:hypothetical protein
MSVWIDIDLLLFQSYVKIRDTPRGTEIFDSVRKKWLVLQPEEWVRQLIISYLTNTEHYPVNHLSIEKSVSKGLKKGRWDVVVFDLHMKPFLLIECKSPKVPITKKTVDQALIYNIKLKAPYVCLTNGCNICCFRVQSDEYPLTFLSQFPDYPVTGM